MKYYVVVEFAIDADSLEEAQAGADLAVDMIAGMVLFAKGVTLIDVQESTSDEC